jgi:GNAT superfamily N-acetyltransferase
VVTRLRPTATVWSSVDVDPDAVLAAYDEQIRRNPQPEFPGGVVESDDLVVRSVTPGDGWSGVTWSSLDDASADGAIAAQIRRFAELSRPWEWKHYSYDRPVDLPQRLLAAGFRPEEPETLLVALVADLELEVPPPDGVRLVPVQDRAGVDAVVSVHEAVFGGDHSGLGRSFLARLTDDPGTPAAVVAVAGDEPVGAGRVEFSVGTDFASLWGGGTVPAWRGRGVFRSMVAHRAALAAARGYRYLQVDALPPSRPILERLGFVQLATTTPYVHPGGAA